MGTLPMSAGGATKTKTAMIQMMMEIARKNLLMLLPMVLTQTGTRILVPRIISLLS
jgi:hypothetical protein